ncbi:hypothetical protein [Beijerinckia sp. L45]|uniref:hypothetical protein n=1 Tax=Beijerinckia sp. L45 TaxID=1641855 RepID=UPI00131CACF1|nr:hypothetical protein [Beijerinckia sp. L45]
MSAADWKRFDAITPEQAHQNALDDPDAQPLIKEKLHRARMNRRERLGIPLDAPDFDIRTLMKPPYDLSIEEAMRVGLNPDFDIKNLPGKGRAAKRPEYVESAAPAIADTKPSNVEDKS